MAMRNTCFSRILWFNCHLSSLHTFQGEFLKAVPFSQVTINDPFWSPRLKLTATSGLLHQWQQLEASGCIDNFRITAGVLEGCHSGWFFADSDAYKWLDAAARFSTVHPNATVNDHMSDLIEILAAAQAPDGYLFTYNQLIFPGSRWENLQIEHELYCHGHLIEAGIAHFEASKQDTLLKLAVKAGNLICKTFLGKGVRFVPGHEEIEIALLSLYQLSGESRYLEMARQFLENRGQVPAPIFAINMLKENARVNQRTRERNLLTRRYREQSPGKSKPAVLTKPNLAPAPRWTKTRFLLSGLSGTYFQQHMPVRSQHSAVGHAVRFAYLQTALARLVRLNGDYSLLPGLRKRWLSMVTKRMYVTGGTGSLPLSEGFGQDYELNPASAYAETCAALGTIFWNAEMKILEQDAAYSDLLERQLYNAALVGIGQNATCYLYNNPLENHDGLQRQDWFEIPCCPSNLARTWAALGGYLYSQSAHTFWIHQYVSSRTQIRRDDEHQIEFVVQSEFPWRGHVSIQIVPEHPHECTLRLRVPSWCDEVHADLDGEPMELVVPASQSHPPTASGYDPRDAQYISIHRTWKKSETLHLQFSMPIRINFPHPAVKSCRGRVAFSRGPLVYCLEGADNPHVDIFQAQIDADSLTPEQDERLGGIVVLNGQTTTGQAVTFIPYAWWANREDNRMAVYVGMSDFPPGIHRSRQQPSRAIPRHQSE